MINHSKHKAVWDWLMTCPAIQNLSFNFAKIDSGTTVLSPDSIFNDTWAEGMPYIDGSGEKEYSFDVVSFTGLTTEPNVENNIDTLIDVSAVYTWILEQNEKRNFPEFPSDCIIDEVELTQGSDDISAESEHNAKYIFGVKIKYYYLKG